MLLVSSSCLAIALAAKSGTLKVTPCQGRFGEYFAIEDDYGLIEVALTADEAAQRVADVVKKTTRRG